MSNEVKWRGIHKLTEEAGELLQVLGKLAAFPEDPHPDGGPPMKERLAREIADVSAAVVYFVEMNNLDGLGIAEMAEAKLQQFKKWKLTGVTVAGSKL